MANYCIAGLHVDMSPRHALTSRRAARYECESSAADMVLPVVQGDANEEYAALAREFYAELLRFDGFLLHASAVEYKGEAVLFSASSGTGKSTHASYWVSQLGAAVLNDDKPAVRMVQGVFSAYGTPFCGKNDISENRGAPIKAIVVLRRGETVTVERLLTREALFSMLDQTVRPSDATQYGHLLSLFEQLLKTVPVYVAYVPNDPMSAVTVAQKLGF